MNTVTTNATAVASNELDQGLIASLARAQGKMENAPLNRVNPHYKSKYADLAAIRDAAVPALAGEGIAFVQLIGANDRGPIVITELRKGAETIRSECPIVVGQNYTPQAFGSALTYARRYSLAAAVGISAEEDDDANVAQEAAKAPQEQGSKPKPPQSQPVRQKDAIPLDDLPPARRVSVPLNGEFPDWSAFSGDMIAAIEATKTAEELTALKNVNSDAINNCKRDAPKSYTIIWKAASDHLANLSKKAA